LSCEARCISKLHGGIYLHAVDLKPRGNEVSKVVPPQFPGQNQISIKWWSRLSRVRESRRGFEAIESFRDSATLPGIHNDVCPIRRIKFRPNISRSDFIPHQSTSSCLRISGAFLEARPPLQSARRRRRRKIPRRSGVVQHFPSRVRIVGMLILQRKP